MRTFKPGISYKLLTVATCTAMWLSACGSGNTGTGDLLADAGALAADANPSVDPVSDPPNPDPEPHDIGSLGTGVTTLAGFTDRGYADGPRNVALFNNPVNVHVGPEGNVYVADFDNGLVRQVTPNGETTTIVNQENFNRPFGMVFSSTGVFYVQTDRNSLGQDGGALWSVDLTEKRAVLLVDNIGRVRGLGALSDGRIVMADTLVHTLRLYDPSDKTMTHLAGTPNSSGYQDGNGTNALFNRPLDLVVTADDEVYVADLLNHRIRKVTLDGEVTTFAGDGVQDSADGEALVASLDSPSGLTWYDDTLYISEFDSGLIRRVRDGKVTTVAGSSPGFADNVDPLLAKLYQNEGLDIDGDGEYIYVADGNGGTEEPYHRIRRFEVSSFE